MHFDELPLQQEYINFTMKYSAQRLLATVNMCREFLDTW